MPEWHAYHDKSSAQHQSEVSSLIQQGFRMISLSVYGNPSNPRYAAVWIKRPGPAFIAVHGRTPEQYQQLFDQHTANGYRPTILSATGGGAAPVVVAGVFEEGTWDCYAICGLNASQFQQQSENLRADGFVIRWLSVYGDSANPLYAGIWGANTRRIGWALETGDDSNTYQKKFNAYTSGWMRVECVAVDGGNRYAAIWYDDLIGKWYSFHGMTADGYQQKIDEMKALGLMPIRVQAGGDWNDPRFAAVFAGRDVAPAREWTVRGEAASGLDAFDQVVKDFMETNSVRAAQLAVVRRGKLVYARAFTHAEPGYPITEPTTVFRIASVSKTITSTAAHSLIDRGQLSLTDAMQSILKLQTPSGGEPTDSDFATIKIWHLLSHVSGLDDSSARSPKVAANALGTSLPISREQYASFVASRSVTNPGSMPPNYNNLGFFMLGQVVAARAGQSYDDYVEQNIFAPLGVTRARVAPSLVQNSLPVEVRYHPSKPGLGSSVMSADDPLVPQQYGTLYTEIGAAMGGWAMTAADYGRLWASFDIGAHNPVMRPSTVQIMWTSPPGSMNALRGWWLSGAGGTVTAIGHNGGLPGTAAAIWRRSDGVSVVVIFNRDLSLDFPDGAPFGTQMNAAISTVIRWPTEDLFPYVGLDAICDDGWRCCNRCQMLFRVGGESRKSCPAGKGGHMEGGSESYTLVHSLPAARGQWGWRQCPECFVLCFSGKRSFGRCSADTEGKHRAGALDYVLTCDEPTTSPGQTDWRLCSRCQSLWYAGSATTGVCAAGPGGHSPAGRENYLLLKF